MTRIERLPRKRNGAIIVYAGGESISLARRYERRGTGLVVAGVAAASFTLDQWSFPLGLIEEANDRAQLMSVVAAVAAGLAVAAHSPDAFGGANDADAATTSADFGTLNGGPGEGLSDGARTREPHDSLAVSDREVGADYRREPSSFASDTALPLTIREREVLGYVASGFSNEEISTYLSISRNTVKYHLSQIMKKLAAANRTEAVLRAIQIGELEA